jgi:hypothetical protein
VTLVRCVRNALVLLIVGGSLHGDDLREVARSPYRIEAYVRSHKTFNADDLWDALGIPAVLSDAYGPIKLKEKFDCRDSVCQAWLQQIQLSLDGSRSVVLPFTQREQQMNRYLVFNDKFRLIGYFDSTFAKYFDPVIYPVDLGGKSWLVLREQVGSGTGFYEMIQRWFEIKSGKLREVLSILDHAFLLSYPGQYVRRTSARVTGLEHTREGDLFRVQYRLDYALPGEGDGVDTGYFGSFSKDVIYRHGRSEAGNAADFS